MIENDSKWCNRNQKEKLQSRDSQTNLLGFSVIIILVTRMRNDHIPWQPWSAKGMSITHEQINSHHLLMTSQDTGRKQTILSLWSQDYIIQSRCPGLSSFRIQIHASDITISVIIFILSVSTPSSLVLWEENTTTDLSMWLTKEILIESDKQNCKTLERASLFHDNSMSIFLLVYFFVSSWAESPRISWHGDSRRKKKGVRNHGVKV